MSLPNALSVARAALALPIAALLALPEGSVALAALLFALGIASDVADGTLARRRGEASAMGALVDTVADKLLVYAVLVPLAWRYPPAMAMLAALVVRDLAVTWRRAHLVQHELVLPVGALARLKTTLLFGGCQLYLVSLALGSFGGIALALAALAAGTAASILSGLRYLLAVRPRRATR